MDEPLLSRTNQLERETDTTNLSVQDLLNDQGFLKDPDIAPLFELSNLNKRRSLASRLPSAPSIFMGIRERHHQASRLSNSHSESNCCTVQCITLLVLAFTIVGIAIIFLTTRGFKGHSTIKVVDSLYYIVVTLCTIGYGDIVPDSTLTRLSVCFFILIGFGFIDFAFNSWISYIFDQHALLLGLMDENQFKKFTKPPNEGKWYKKLITTYIMDIEKGRMRIRTRVCFAFLAVILCIAIGMFGIHFLEKISWADSFYVSVTSVTTVGYGDFSFKTFEGRLFAILWLSISTCAVGHSFLYLAELRIDKRNRKTAKLVLRKKIKAVDLAAADLDYDGAISKSEYIIFKLKEMGKIAETDIIQISREFDSLEHNNRGKITLADI
ncbi:Two pore domain potassium channel [Parasponia andersonii]|uniref:Two pore domain potassium channel n=1 Tax=Parasponia andersonii TaxID=3476 RepID=A0A2P5D823_PARAD|nr:Two pore domain potassium channel [Parasponia andersonii]